MNSSPDIVASIVASHPRREIAGRTRLQKTINLLQRLNLPTSYQYRMYYYGPYSDGLQSDLLDLCRSGALKEDSRTSSDGYSYSIFRCATTSGLVDTAPWADAIAVLANASSHALELASTFCAYRDLGLECEDAWAAVKSKKPDKYGARSDAENVLKEIGLKHFLAS